MTTWTASVGISQDKIFNFLLFVIKSDLTKFYNRKVPEGWFLKIGTLNISNAVH